MPYEAAKAIAATFCWKMRYALTPVFGLDFPDTCLPPDDPHYGDMILDHEITKRCTDEAAAYRVMELENRSVSARASPLLPSPLTPSTPTHPRPYKELRPKTANFDTPQSGYSTGTESSLREEKYQLNSARNDYYRNVWTPANTPSSAAGGARLPTARDIVAGINASAKRGASAMSDSSSGSGMSSSAVSPKTKPKTKRVYPVDEEYDDESSGSDEEMVVGDLAGTRGRDGLAGLRGRDGRMLGRGRMPSDERAAYLLMGLRLQRLGEESIGEDMLGMKRRATG
jgi:hypothetical protein